MRSRTLRYRSPTIDGPPLIGGILMRDGPRVRRGYRILAASKAKSRAPGLGTVMWRLHVEPMSAARAKQEVEAGVPRWSMRWDRKRRG